MAAGVMGIHGCNVICVGAIKLLQRKLGNDGGAGSVTGNSKQLSQDPIVLLSHCSAGQTPIITWKPVFMTLPISGALK